MIKIIDFEAAKKIAIEYFCKNENFCISKIYEAETVWIVFATNNGKNKYGGYGISIDKKTGNVSKFILPSKENFEILNNAKLIELKNRNVVFLDYDGVVNTPMWDNNGKHCRYNFPRDNKVNNFQCVQWVSEFCEKFGYDIVVSSSWRTDANYKECLINGGLRKDIKILGRTPATFKYSRGREIQMYLDEHPEIENFLIFDDEDDMENLSDHLVLCNTAYGFCMPEYSKAEMLHHKFEAIKEAKSFLGVVRNYQGLYEMNYLMTIDDFKKEFVSVEPRTDFFSTHSPEEDWKNFIKELEKTGQADWALANNDTMIVYKVDKDNIVSFLSGDFNEDVIEVVMNNLDCNDVVGSISRYAGWSWTLNTDKSSEEALEWVSKICPYEYSNSFGIHRYSFNNIFEAIKGLLNKSQINECKKHLEGGCEH